MRVAEPNRVTKHSRIVTDTVRLRTLITKITRLRAADVLFLR